MFLLVVMIIKILLRSILKFKYNFGFSEILLNPFNFIKIRIDEPSIPDKYDKFDFIDLILLIIDFFLYYIRLGKKLIKYTFKFFNEVYYFFYRIIKIFVRLFMSVCYKKEELDLSVGILYDKLLGKEYFRRLPFDYEHWVKFSEIPLYINSKKVGVDKNITFQEYLLLDTFFYGPLVIDLSSSCSVIKNIEDRNSRYNDLLKNKCIKEINILFSRLEGIYVESECIIEEKIDSDNTLTVFVYNEKKYI